MSTIQSEEEKSMHRHWGPLRESLTPFFGPLRRWGLNPIKPVYDRGRPDGWLNLTASAFNQLGQYTSSPGHRGYCYAELAVFFPSGGRNHRQYSLRLPTEGWPGWVGLGGWLHSEYSLPAQRQSPIPLLTELNVEQLSWSRPKRYCYTTYSISSSKMHWRNLWTKCHCSSGRIRSLSTL